MTLRSIIDFIVGLVRDPNSKDMSSARLCALLFALTAIVIAVGNTFFLKNPPGDGLAATITAFVGGGTVALLSRKKSDGDGA